MMQTFPKSLSDTCHPLSVAEVVSRDPLFIAIRMDPSFKKPLHSFALPL
jgi:hypothetical protein